MVDHAARPPLPERHVESIEHDLSVQGDRHRPADDPAAECKPALVFMAPNPRARARGAALAARARGWCATAPRFKQLR
jgi:hypothetical protein